MNRITVGKERRKSNAPQVTERNTFREDAVTALGLCAVCLMLLVPVNREVQKPDNAVAVMSSSVDGYREVLREADEPALSVESDDSIFDYIGRMFAELLFGA